MDRPVTNPRKVLRSPVIRRKSKPTPLSERVHLEKVLGLTVSNNAALAVDSHTGTIAYPAGCVVVLYNPKRNKQQHIFNHSHKAITCLAYSADGKHLITGECGHQPAVRVWELEERTQVAEFHGHKFGVACVAFHPNQKYVVSIGTQHDMVVNLWNWRTNTKLASNKVASKVTDLSFSEDGSVFATVGNRHVKFWYLDANKSRVKETVPLLGRSGILGEQRNNFFCASAFGRGEQSSSMFCITRSGLLCEFNEKRLLDKWVELRTTSANCITVGQRDIFIGCADGIIRVFNAKTLNFVATLPRPHYLGVDVAAGLEPSHMSTPHNDATYPDTIAIRLDRSNQKISCVYNDHSLYIWDVNEVRKVGKTRSFLFHSSCIWDLDMYPVLEDKNKALLPPGSFFTCSSDNTIRVWNLDPHMSTETTLKRNIYSQELLKVIYSDRELNNIKDVDFNPAGKTDKTDTQCMEKNGVRAIQVSPDGQHLASGDRVGNIRIHNLQYMEELCMLEAHNSEVLCLEYTDTDIDVGLLASASRDRLIHVFDPHQNYDIVQTLDDHSSAITAVRFTQQDGQLHMLSCGADKSLLFRTLQKDEEEAESQFVLNRHLVGKTTLYDMDVDPTQKYVATACQDRNVRIYNITNGKQKKCYKGSNGDDGTLIKVQLDPSGAYLATSCSDKNLSINDFFTGECMATMFGHSELVTGVKFMKDLKHMISVSGDGCIFVWRLPLDFTEHMQQRLLSLGKIPQGGLIPTQDTRRGTFVTNSSKIPPSISVGNNKPDYPVIETDFQPATKVIEDLAEGEPENNDNNLTVGHRDGYRFSVGQLPAWAKKQVMSDPAPKASSTMSGQTAPKGRWAQRIDTQGIVMKSQLDDNKHIELSLSDSEKRRFTVEPELLQEQIKQANLMRRETVVLPRSEHKLAIPVITDDDENNRDDEDEDDEFCQDPEKMKNMFEENALGLKDPGKVTFSRGSDPMSRTPGRVLEPRPHRFSDFTGLWRKRGSLTTEDADEDEEEDNQDEMIYYLPNEDASESSETIASSFRVIEGDTASYKDAGEMESEGTDPLSLSDESAPPTPTTPRDVSKDFADAAEEEEFLRRNFENLGASPALQGETFGESLDQLEKQLNNSNFFSHRLSISSRFLSRAQQQHLKNIAMQGMQQQQQQQQQQQRSRSQSPSMPPQTLTRRMARDEDGSRTPNPEEPQESNRRSRSSLTGSQTPTRGRRSETGERVSETEVRLDSPVRTRSRSSRAEGDRRSSTPSFNSNKTPTNGEHTTPTKTKKPLTRVHSYQKPTTSSTSKTSKTSISNSTTSLNKEADATNKIVPKKGPGARRSRFNNGLKEKFKSTPDLAGDGESNDDFNMMTAEDMYVASKNQDNIISRQHMPAARDIQDPYSRNAMPANHADLPMMPKEGSPDDGAPPLPASDPPNGNFDDDRVAMPPPLSGTLPRAKGKAKKSVTSDLTLSQAKAILRGQPLPSRSDSIESDQGMPADVATTDSSVCEEPMERTARPKLPPPPADTLLNLPYRDGPTSSIAAASYHDMDASPNEPPVKDEPSSMKSPRSRRERSPGVSPGRISPFVGQKCEVFENLQSPSSRSYGGHDRAWEDERRDSGEGSSPGREGDPQSVNNKTYIMDDSAHRPGSPLKSPLKNISQNRSFSMGDIKQFASMDMSVSGSTDLSEHRSSSEEQLFEPSVQKRVAQFELASPRTQRRMLASGGGRWRQRLLQVGEGDEGGLEGEPLSMSNPFPKSPNTPLSPPSATTPPSLPPREVLHYPSSTAGVTIKTSSPPRSAAPVVSPTATHPQQQAQTVLVGSRGSDANKPLVNIAVTEFVSNPRSSLTFTFNRPPVATTAYTTSTTATSTATQRPLISSKTSDTLMSSGHSSVMTNTTTTTMQHSSRPGGPTSSSSSSPHSLQQLTSQNTVSTTSSPSQPTVLNVPSNRANASYSESLPLSPQTSPSRPSHALNQTYVKTPTGHGPTSPPTPCVSIPESVVTVSGADRTVSVSNAVTYSGLSGASHALSVESKAPSAQTSVVNKTQTVTASSVSQPPSSHHQTSQAAGKSNLLLNQRERNRSGEERSRRRSGEDMVIRRKDSLPKQVTWKDIAEEPSSSFSHKSGSPVSSESKRELVGGASGEPSASLAAAAAGPLEGTPEEIPRPDKSRMSPPLSLTTTPPQEINRSRVVLTHPSPAETVSPKPDRSRLVLPISPSGDDSAGSDDSACARAVCNLQSAVDNIVVLLDKVSDDGDKAMLVQALAGARKDIDTVLPTDKKTEEILHTYSHQLSDRIYTLLQSKLDPR